MKWMVIRFVGRQIISDASKDDLFFNNSVGLQVIFHNTNLDWFTVIWSSSPFNINKCDVLLDNIQWLFTNFTGLPMRIVELVLTMGTFSWHQIIMSVNKLSRPFLLVNLTFLCLLPLQESQKVTRCFQMVTSWDSIRDDVVDLSVNLVVFVSLCSLQ